MSKFECTIWGVEHGNSAFISCPNDKSILMDAGISNDFSPAILLRKFYGLSQSDKLIISHPHRDHIEDLPNIVENVKPRILQRNRGIPKDIIYPSDEYYSDPVFLAYKKLDEDYVHDIADTDKPSPISNWGNVEVITFSNKPEWLSGDNLNNLSLLTVIRYGRIEIVFPGDLEPQGWDAIFDNTDLLDNINRTEIKILVAPHHGRKSGVRNSDDSIYSRFLDIIQPDLTVISDKWKTETTDAETYRQHSTGLTIFDVKKSVNEIKKVITTKTNDYISIKYENDTVSIITG